MVGLIHVPRGPMPTSRITRPCQLCDSVAVVATVTIVEDELAVCGFCQDLVEAVKTTCNECGREIKRWAGNGPPTPCPCSMASVEDT